MKRWWYWPIAALALTVCALVGVVIDHALIPPHTWGDSAAKGVSILAGGIAGATVLRLITRHRPRG